MLEQLKMLRAKRALPLKQALAIQPTEIFLIRERKRLILDLKVQKSADD